MHRQARSEQLGVRVQVEEGDGGRVATFLPGRTYSCDAPVMYYVRFILRARGWTLRTVTWQVAPGPEELHDLGPELLGAVAPPCHLIVAKALSTRLLPLAVEMGLPGIWLTPLLKVPEVQRAAQEALTPTLFIGGLDDPFWNPAFVDRTGQWVLQLPGVDHALERPGDLEASLTTLRTVITVVERFINALEDYRSVR